MRRARAGNRRTAAGLTGATARTLLNTHAFDHRVYRTGTPATPLNRGLRSRPAPSRQAIPSRRAGSRPGKWIDSVTTSETPAASSRRGLRSPVPGPRRPGVVEDEHGLGNG